MLLHRNMDVDERFRWLGEYSRVTGTNFFDLGTRQQVRDRGVAERGWGACGVDNQHVTSQASQRGCASLVANRFGRRLILVGLHAAIPTGRHSDP